jgi:hypothetical protein
MQIWGTKLVYTQVIDCENEIRVLLIENRLK